MSTDALIFMLATWAAITYLIAYCYWKTMTANPRKTSTISAGGDQSGTGASGGDR